MRAPYQSRLQCLPLQVLKKKKSKKCGHLLLARGDIKIIFGGDKALGGGGGGLQTERAVVHLVCTVPTVLKIQNAQAATS